MTIFIFFSLLSKFYDEPFLNFLKYEFLVKFSWFFKILKGFSHLDLFRTLSTFLVAIVPRSYIIFFRKISKTKKILRLKMTRKNSLQDILKTLIPIFEFWNFLFQIVKVDYAKSFGGRCSCCSCCTAIICYLRCITV